MRIAYLAQSYPPMVSGAAIVANKFAKSMKEHGYPILLMVINDRGEVIWSILE